MRYTLAELVTACGFTAPVVRTIHATGGPANVIIDDTEAVISMRVDGPMRCWTGAAEEAAWGAITVDTDASIQVGLADDALTWGPPLPFEEEQP